MWWRIFTSITSSQLYSVVSFCNKVPDAMQQLLFLLQCPNGGFKVAETVDIDIKHNLFYIYDKLPEWTIEWKQICSAPTVQSSVSILLGDSKHLFLTLCVILFILPLLMFHSEFLSLTFLLFELLKSFVPQTSRISCGSSSLFMLGRLTCMLGVLVRSCFCLHVNMDEKYLMIFSSFCCC